MPSHALLASNNSVAVSARPSVSYSVPSLLPRPQRSTRHSRQHLPTATRRTIGAHRTMGEHAPVAAAGPSKSSAQTPTRSTRTACGKMWTKRSGSYDTAKTIHASLCERLVRLADIPPGACLTGSSMGAGPISWQND